MRCPLCRDPIRPGQPVALVELNRGRERRTRIIHLVPCGALLLALNDALKTAELLATADALGTTPSTN
jgi:hypothetical protein